MYNNDINAEKQALRWKINGSIMAPLSDNCGGKVGIRVFRVVTAIAQPLLLAKPKLLLPDKIKVTIKEKSGS